MAEVAAKAVQADWSQNDETAADYVKNRTHYEADEEIALLENYTSDMYYNSEVSIPEFDFVVGKTYKVVWNNEEYECVCKAPYGYETIGKIGGVGDYPFSIEKNGYIEVFDDESWTLSIYDKQYVLKTLDEKFIPDTIARVADVEAHISYFVNKHYFYERRKT